MNHNKLFLTIYCKKNHIEPFYRIKYASLNIKRYLPKRGRPHKSAIEERKAMTKRNFNMKQIGIREV